MSDPCSYHICVLEMEFFIPHSHSLKEKRSVVRKVKDRIKARYNASVAEVGMHDLWQRSLIAVCMVSGSRKLLSETVEKVLNDVEMIVPSMLSHFSVDYF